MDYTQPLYKIASQNIGKKYKTAAQFKAAIDEYFAWCEANPFKGESKSNLRGDKKDITSRAEAGVEKPRPMTLVELATFIGVPDWWDYKRDHKHWKGFAEIFAYAEGVVKSNQQAGGFAGYYSANLTARVNGLSENINTNEKPPIQLLPDEIEQ